MELRNVYADKKSVQDHVNKTEIQLAQIMAAQKILSAQLNDEISKNMEEFNEELKAQRAMLGNLGHGGDQPLSGGTSEE